jgi:hypothetical protein
MTRNGRGAKRTKAAISLSGGRASSRAAVVAGIAVSTPAAAALVAPDGRCGARCLALVSFAAEADVQAAGSFESDIAGDESSAERGCPQPESSE